MIQTVQKYIEIFNIKGGPLMGLWTLTLIIMTAVGKPIDPSAVNAYQVAIVAFGVSKGHSRWMETKQCTKKVMEAGDV